MEIKHVTEEKAGSSYITDSILEARQRAWKSLERLSTHIRVGMTEGEAILLAREIFDQDGAEKHWHKPVVRFGQGTTKYFEEKFDPDQKLQEDDIYFLDFGPVYNNIEADVGKTFVVGGHSEYHRCVGDAEALWHDMRNVWVSEKLTGQQLYDFGLARARALGWHYKLEGAEGHRVSDFPHKAYYEGNIKDLDFQPSPLLWVLEVQLVDPRGKFGAFYEDLLM